MTKTRFNKLWDKLHKSGYVEFQDHGDELSMSLVPSRYGKDVSLEVKDGHYRNVVLVHWSKDRFAELLLD